MTTMVIQQGRPLKLANVLGWFSIALGLVELFAPRRVGRMVGVEGNGSLLQAYGLREFFAGVGILAARRKAPWLWARVAGDALDLATLAPGLYSIRRNRQLATGLAVAAVAVIGLLDIYSAVQAQGQR
ncbi:hypothetical protein [Methylocystis sp.]|uniref:hypothetical protein n=1 Tax=Methylocystis sp. TaxID=1911079 RepID=UPI002734500A|nr:hypothetical protein [Methylocystis sp.]MDP3553187.1 hypothetical protein [Methylocystis sp.]